MSSARTQYMRKLAQPSLSGLAAGGVPLGLSALAALYSNKAISGMSESPSVDVNRLLDVMKAHHPQKGAVGIGPQDPPHDYAYDMESHRVRSKAGDRTPLPALAHELGHAQQYAGGFKPWRAVTRLSRAATPLAIVASALTTALSRNERVSRNVALAGTVAMLPMLAEETGASARGYRGMRGIGQGRLESAKSFIGLPTYAAASLQPILLHNLKKQLGGFK
jgi:hypothetical protein